MARVAIWTSPLNVRGIPECFIFLRVLSFCALLYSLV
jgi:hypothetical protein